MRMSRMFVALALLGVVLAATSPGHAATERRVALVIGNNGYKFADPLKTAINDARAMRDQFKASGFEVIFREDAERTAMLDAVDEFIGKLSSDSVGAVFYSGHGIQINGSNYLIPVDLSATKETDIVHNGLDLGMLLAQAGQKKPRFSLAIIDACRNNPFKTGTRALGTRGLAEVKPQGTLVIYSAGTGQTALDRVSDTDTNGLFTREFLQVMRMPGLSVQEAVAKVRVRVIDEAKKLGQEQTPALYDESTGVFSFVPGNAPAAASVAPAAAAGGDDVRRISAEAEKARADAARAKSEAEKAKAELELARLKASANPPPPPSRQQIATASTQSQPSVPESRETPPAWVGEILQKAREAQKRSISAAAGARWHAEEADKRRNAVVAGTYSREGWISENLPNDVRYEGYRNNRRFDGLGIRTEAKVRVWGKWSNGLMANGILQGDTGRYEGDWVNGKFGGTGVLSRSDGAKYEGEFLDGKIHGYGVQTYSDGHRYEGEFVNTHYEGRGVFFDAAGKMTGGGTFKDGKRIASASASR